MDGLIFLSVLIFSLCETSLSERKSYDGDKVLAIKVRRGVEWDFVLSLIDKYIPIKDQDVWKEPLKSRPTAYLYVQEKYLKNIKYGFDEANIEYDIYIENVESLVKKSEEENKRIKDTKFSNGPKRDVVGMFATYDEIIEWMNEIVALYPDLASTFDLGYTTMGRSMQGLRLGLGNGNKWRVWLDSGLHAREWLSVTTAIYVANQLIEGYINNDEEILNYLTVLEFHIVPVANPDGYDYTFTDDRLWRKNTRPVTADCIGVDLNRNFNFEWGGEGASSDPCSNTYMGPYPNSEHEVANIVAYILPEADKFIWYMAYHTWGELFFTRWDYSVNAADLPPDHQQLSDLAQLAVDAINSVHGEAYLAGTAPDLMYAFSGSSSDWSRGVANIKYPFLTEVRDSTGDYGFVAPPEEIIPCGEENWAGFKVILADILQNYGDVSPPAN